MKKILLFTIAVLFSYTIIAQWTLLNSGTTANYTSVYFPVVDTGYAVTAVYNNGGKIFATTDGDTWSQQFTSADYLLNVFFLTSKVGWAGGGILGSNGVILKTTNGGLNWNTQTTSLQQVYSIYFTNNTNGWAIGNDATQGKYYIYNTTNGGTNWNTQKTGNDYIRSIFFRNSQLGWIAGDNGRIFNTTDGGVNWVLQNTSVVFHFNSIQFISDNIGWSVGSYINGGCYKTTNGGFTWGLQNIGTNAKLYGVWFISPNNGWAVGENGTILKTTNGGDNWSAESSPTSNTLISVHFPDSHIGYAVGNNGTIIKYDDLNGISETENNFHLSVFPNPSFGKFVINIDDSELSVKDIYLEIYNVLGEKIYLFNLKQQTSKEIDLSGAPKGIYFIKINEAKKSCLEKIVIQ
jgi:photosystem II stability/assembly factor-like uncharacterized protein